MLGRFFIILVNVYHYTGLVISYYFLNEVVKVKIGSVFWHIVVSFEHYTTFSAVLSLYKLSWHAALKPVLAP